VLSTITVPIAAAARAVAHSPSGCASRWNAVGATSTGIDTGVPNAVVASAHDPTSTRHFGRSRIRRHAASLSPNVTSSSAPLA